MASRTHLTPTSASTRPAIRRGSFESVRAPTGAIERFTREWNAGASPPTWIKTAGEILAKAVRKAQADSGAVPHRDG